jgi:hypothetical protein
MGQTADGQLGITYLLKLYPDEEKCKPIVFYSIFSLADSMQIHQRHVGKV